MRSCGPGLSLIVGSEEDLEVVGEAGNARDAIFEARSLKPDVILLDVVMPDQSGLDVLPTLLHEQPQVRVLVLSMQDDPQYVRRAFAEGASGYVLKEAADTEVVAAIREVAGGGRYVHPELGARLIAAEADEERRAAEDPLSDREREVLASWRSATPTRRSPSSCTSRSVRPRRTGRTSCRSSVCPPVPSLSGTRSRTGYSTEE